MKSLDYEKEASKIRDAWYALTGAPMAMPAMTRDESWVQTVLDDAVIVTSAGELWRVPYTKDADGVVTFAAQDQWQKVEQVYAPAKALDDTLRQAAESGLIVEEDAIVSFGGAIKSLGNGHYGGDLVIFSDAKSPDLTGQYFDAATDYGLPKDGAPLKTAVYFNHRQPLPTKSGDYIVIKDQIGEGELTKKDNSIFIDMVLYNAKRYEDYLGVMGLSSGTAEHLIEVEPVGKAEHVKRWPLGLDASMTPTPAEPDTRARIVPLKSLTSVPKTQAVLQGAGDAPNAGTSSGAEAKTTQTHSTKGVTTMPEVNQAAASPDLITAVQANTEAVKGLLDKLSTPGTSMQIESSAGVAGIQAHDVQKSAYKSVKDGGLGDFLRDVYQAGRPEGGVSERLANHQSEAVKALKATGANESVASDGGFLLQADVSPTLIQPLHEVGIFSSKIDRMTVGPNANSLIVNVVDETSRATGSRWGGVQGYRLGEAGTLSTSRPKFTQMETKLHKYGVAFYATDEVLQDTTALQSVATRSSQEELDFLINDDIFEGTGQNGAKGVMKSGALITVAAEVGQGAGTILYENLIKMWARLYSRSKANSNWYINTDVTPQLAQLVLKAGTGALPANFITYGQDGVMRMFGRPVIETEFNPTLGTTGDIMLADLSEYVGIEKGGIQTAASIHVQFLAAEQVFRFLYRFGGQPKWQTALTPFKGSNTQSPYVVLATRS